VPTPQDLDRYFPIVFGIGIAQFVIVVLLSIRYRRTHGKPIVFRDVPGAQFIEKRASGHSHRTWYTRLAGAKGCLIVAVKDGRLIIRPVFPFTMMFLPEIYGLEYEAALNQVKRAVRDRSSVRLGFRDTSGVEQDVTLYLHNPQAFLDALGHLTPLHRV
jgi:hypothetical protein